MRWCMQKTYRELAEGKGFRLAVGNFMNAFFLFHVDKRQQLINDPIQIPENPTEDQLGWAAFCAGAAEYLAEQYGLQCPEWAHNPTYQMPEPWYIVPDSNPSMREHLQEATPLPWKVRNVFCGKRVFTNQHPSSCEPGNYAELLERRKARLATMSQTEKEAYITRMSGKPRVTIIV